LIAARDGSEAKSKSTDPPFAAQRMGHPGLHRAQPDGLAPSLHLDFHRWIHCRTRGTKSRRHNGWASRPPVSWETFCPSPVARPPSLKRIQSYELRKRPRYALNTEISITVARKNWISPTCVNRQRAAKPTARCKNKNNAKSPQNFGRVQRDLEYRIAFPKTRAVIMAKPSHLIGSPAEEPALA